MASRTIEEVIDDLDGLSKADEQVTFGLGGQSYVIDLSSKHAQKLRELLAPYIAAARIANKRPGVRQVKRQDYEEVRTWCRANGVPVSTHGRISKEALDAYDSRNQGGAHTLSAVG